MQKLRPRPKDYFFRVRASSKPLGDELSSDQVQAIINGSLEDEACERCGLSVATECECELTTTGE